MHDFETLTPAPPPLETTRPGTPVRCEENDAGLISSTVKYLMRTEVHTYAFSVAANAILSFFPSIVLLMSLVRNVFHSQRMYDVVVEILRDYLPVKQDFIVRNLNALVHARNGAQVASFVILLVTSSGIFLPLEVALNEVWGIEK